MTVSCAMTHKHHDGEEWEYEVCCHISTTKPTFCWCWSWLHFINVLLVLVMTSFHQYSNMCLFWMWSVIWNQVNKLHHWLLMDGRRHMYLCVWFELYQTWSSLLLRVLLLFSPNKKRTRSTQRGGGPRGRGGTWWHGRWRLPRLKSIYEASQVRNDTNNNRKGSPNANKHNGYKEYILQTLFIHKNGKNMTHLPNLLPVDLDPEHNNKI